MQCYSQPALYHHRFPPDTRCLDASSVPRDSRVDRFLHLYFILHATEFLSIGSSSGLVFPLMFTVNLAATLTFWELDTVEISHINTSSPYGGVVLRLDVIYGAPHFGDY